MRSSAGCRPRTRWTSPARPDGEWRVAGQDLAALTARALAERSEGRRLRSAADAVSSKAAAAAAATRPQLGLTAAYTRIDNEFLNRDDYWAVGVDLQWSAFDGGRARHRASALSLESPALERQRRDLESMIALEGRQAWLAPGAAGRVR